MDISAIDRDIERWGNFLRDAGGGDEAIRAQLARFLLVHICGQYEIIVGEAIKSRAERSGDRPLALYVSQTFRPYRQMSFRELEKNMPAKFGRKHGDRPARQAGAGGRGSCNGIITSRNRSAPGQPARAAPGGLAARREGAKDVLRAFEEALAATPPPPGGAGKAPK